MHKLNHDEIAALESVLRARRSELAGALRSRLHEDGAAQPMRVGTACADAEAPQADLLGDTELAMLGQESRALDAVEQALARVSDGSYGYCSRCGGAIPLPRLRAQPAAALCLACQQESERHYHVPSI